MSTKVLKKELMAAVAMVLVALIALSGSTYAWFAENTKATAEFMEVTATTASPFLQIATGTAASHGTYTTTLTLDGATKDNLKLVAPGTISAIGEVEWYYANSELPSEAVTTESATHYIVTDEAVTLKDYVLTQKLVIQNADANITANTLKVTAKITTPEAGTLDQAVRVLVVTSDGAYALFDHTGVTIKGESGVTDDSNVTLAATIAPGAELNITAYVFFDGNHNVAKNTTKVTDVAIKCRLEFLIEGDPDHSTLKNPWDS